MPSLFTSRRVLRTYPDIWKRTSEGIASAGERKHRRLPLFSLCSLSASWELKNCRSSSLTAAEMDSETCFFKRLLAKRPWTKQKQQSQQPLFQ